MIKTTLSISIIGMVSILLNAAASAQTTIRHQDELEINAATVQVAPAILVAPQPWDALVLEAPHLEAQVSEAPVSEGPATTLGTLSALRTISGAAETNHAFDFNSQQVLSQAVSSQSQSLWLNQFESNQSKSTQSRSTQSRSTQSRSTQAESTQIESTQPTASQADAKKLKFNVASYTGPLSDAGQLFAASKVDSEFRNRAIVATLFEREQGSAESTPWEHRIYTWSAPHFYHRPIYFQQINLERYGIGSRPLVSPIQSAAHFYGSMALWPAKMIWNWPTESVYSLGHQRPGDCVHYQRCTWTE